MFSFLKKKKENTFVSYGYGLETREYDELAKEFCWSLKDAFDDIIADAIKLPISEDRQLIWRWLEVKITQDRLSANIRDEKNIIFEDQLVFSDHSHGLLEKEEMRLIAEEMLHEMGLHLEYSHIKGIYSDEIGLFITNKLSPDLIIKLEYSFVRLKI